MKINFWIRKEDSGSGKNILDPEEVLEPEPLSGSERKSFPQRLVIEPLGEVPENKSGPLRPLTTFN